MEDVMLTVSLELLMTMVASAAPLKTTTEEETKPLPVSVMTKLGGSCANTTFAGEIDLRLGTGRALPQSGFRALHPGRSKSTASHEVRKTILQKGMSYPRSSPSTRPYKVLMLALIHGSRLNSLQSSQLLKVEKKPNPRGSGLKRAYHNEGVRS